MIRNSHPEIFRWLPIGRIGPPAGSLSGSLAGSGPSAKAGRDGSHKRRYLGNPDFYGLEATVVFSPHLGWSKGCCRTFRCERKIDPSWPNRFTSRSFAAIVPTTNFPVT